MTKDTRADAPVLEPLEDLAWQAFHAAPHSCDPSYGCATYHRMWSVMRLLTTNGAPPRGLAFFSQNIAELAAKGQTVRILLAGSADTGLPTLLANAAMMAGRVPSITVVDRCATPLNQIGELAKRTGLDITTLQGKLDDVDHAAFDAAITHNVMLFNDDAARQEIFKKIAKGLKAGGRLLSTESICDSYVPPSASAIAAKISIIDTAVARRDLAPALANDVRDAARAYYASPRRVAAYCEADMKRHVASAGLSLLSFEKKLKTAVSPRGAMPVGNPSDAYAFFAAEKPS